MISTAWLWEAAGWLSLPVLLALSVVIPWKKLQREFPLFWGYCLTALILGLVRFVVYKRFSTTAYFYTYWYSDFVGLVATFLAIYETFLRRLFPRFSRVGLYRHLFPAAAALIGLLAFLTAVHLHDRRAAFYVTSHVFDFLRSAVIGFFVFLILAMGREFSGLEFAITAGFGIQSAVALANWAFKSISKNRLNLDAYELIAYDLACFIWLWSFCRSLGASRILPDQADASMLHEARKWESSLKDWLTPGKR